MISVPVISPGIKSGVNWIRRKVKSIESASVRTINVLANPGTPSSRQWPRDRIAINNWSSAPERIGDGKKVADDFVYASDNNDEWMPVEELRNWIEKNATRIGKI